MRLGIFFAVIARETQPMRPTMKITRIIMGRTIMKSHFIHEATFSPLPAFASAW